MPYVYPEDQGGGVGPGRHAFTVAADDGGRLTAMRLPPDAVDALPRNVARRLLQLAKSTNAASVEAREALSARSNAADSDTDANRARVAFGTSTPPPAPLVHPRRRFAARRSVEDGRAPVGVGLGGGGGRTREVAEAGKRRQAKRTLARPATAGSGRGSRRMGGGGASSASTRPRTASPSRVGDVGGYDAFLRGPPSREGLASSTPTGRTHAEVAAAATREAMSAERRLREVRATTPSRSGAPGTGSARRNTPPRVRMTKKAAALAEKNKPRERFEVSFPRDANATAEIAPPDAPGARGGAATRGRVVPGGEVVPGFARGDFARESIEVRGRVRSRAREGGQ